MTKFMWFQLVSILILLAVLIAVCVVEDDLVSSSLSLVDDYCYEIEVAIDCYEIEVAIEENDGIKNSDVCTLVDNLEYSWFANEWKLCYVVNHKSIQEIGVEISRLKSYIEEGDEKEFRASLELIKLYREQYEHFMGASLHNIL